MTLMNPRAQHVPKTKVERVKRVKITEALTKDLKAVDGDQLLAVTEENTK